MIMLLTYYVWLILTQKNCLSEQSKIKRVLTWLKWNQVRFDTFIFHYFIIWYLQIRVLFSDRGQLMTAFLHSTKQSITESFLKLLVFMIAENQYDCELKMNPFMFRNFGMSSIQLKKDGLAIPSQPITYDFTNNKTAEAYNHVLEHLHLGNWLHRTRH